MLSMPLALASLASLVCKPSLEDLIILRSLLLTDTCVLVSELCSLTLLGIGDRITNCDGVTKPETTYNRNLKQYFMHAFPHIVTKEHASQTFPFHSRSLSVLAVLWNGKGLACETIVFCQLRGRGWTFSGVTSSLWWTIKLSSGS